MFALLVVTSQPRTTLHRPNTPLAEWSTAPAATIYSSLLCFPVVKTSAMAVPPLKTFTELQQMKWNWNLCTVYRLNH
jgi:hypothetical protein